MEQGLGYANSVTVENLLATEYHCTDRKSHCRGGILRYTSLNEGKHGRGDGRGCRLGSGRPRPIILGITEELALIALAIRALPKLVLLAFGGGLTAMAAAYAVQIHYDSIDPVAIAPLQRTNHLRFQPGQTGDYWVTIVIRPNPLSRVDGQIVDAIKCDSITAFNGPNRIQVNQIQRSGSSSDLGLHVAEARLERNHTYDFSTVCSGFDKLPQTYSAKLMISASHNANFTRNNLMMTAVIVSILCFVLGTILSVLLMILRQTRRP